MLITIREAMEESGLSYDVIRRAAKRGEIAGIVSGSNQTWYLNRYSFENWLDERRKRR